MPRKQHIIGGTTILAGLFYFCCHGDQRQQLLSHGSNMRSAPNQVLLEREKKGISANFVDRKAQVRSGNRIVGGTPVAKGEYPYSAKSVGKSLCGATLIWEDVLLSAAHCEGIFLSGGAAIGGTKLNNSDATTFEVESEYIHPKFNYWSFANGTLGLIKAKQYCTHIHRNSKSHVSPCRYHAHKIEGEKHGATCESYSCFLVCAI
jgi:hypothetical protein